MGAETNDAAVVEDDNEVGGDHRLKAVGDHQDSAVLAEFAESDADFLFGVGIDLAHGFIENEHGGVVEDGARDGDALFLAAGETYTVLANHGFVAVREAGDVFIGKTAAGGIEHFFAGGVSGSVGYVVVNSVGEEEGVLGDESDLAAEAAERNGADVDAIDEDAAAGGNVETGRRFRSVVFRCR